MSLPSASRDKGGEPGGRGGPDGGMGSRMPTAYFSYAATSTPLRVQFTDLSVTDSAGTAIVTWEWVAYDGTGTALTGQNPAHTFPSPGAYNVLLRVFDANGKTSTHSRSITVTGEEPATEPPSADFTLVADGLTIEPINPSLPPTFNFSLSDASSPGAGSPHPVVNWEWTFAGPASPQQFSGQNPPAVAYESSAAGTYDFTLTVTDSAGLQATATKQATVPAGPTADFTFDEGLAITFADASDAGTSPPIVRWDWTFGGEAFPLAHTGQVPPLVSYASEGTNEVTLTVTDSAGIQDTATKQVTTERLQ